MQKIHNTMKVSTRFLTSNLAPVTLLFLFILVVISGCTSSGPKDSSAQNSRHPIAQELVQKKPNEISVMTFNVENLFDTTHDKDREDFTYLPLKEKSKVDVKNFCAQQKAHYRDECNNLNWDEDILKVKLNNIGTVIRYIDGGKGPDNILFAEVENISILNRLAKEQLKDLGYQTVVLIEGPDLRGIDPGFISKFPQVGEAKLHLIPYEDSNPEQLKWAKRSRGILEVTVKLPNQKKLTFLSAHFPSQSNPVAWRSQAIQFAKKLMTDYQKQGRAVIFGGDLNITADEEDAQGFFKTQMSEVGQVSHLVGCKACEGSHFYRGHWSFLDILVYSKNLPTAAKVELIPDSLQVVKVPVHMKRNGTPLRFDVEKREGVSDHFPLYSRLKILE
ncbi:MAG: endonuclease/exonuclease/phosphatase family protein [Bdellovibrio sp.]|nr:endonuclease/exonuclease/phosphatase family protein [Bdellovibrio sp.]